MKAHTYIQCAVSTPIINQNLDSYSPQEHPPCRSYHFVSKSVHEVVVSVSERVTHDWL